MYLIVTFLLALAAIIAAFAGELQSGTILAVVTVAWVAGRPAAPQVGPLPEVRRLDHVTQSTTAEQPWAWSYHGRSGTRLQ
jgi:hypothetical protein